MEKNTIIEKVCYTDLVFERVNKKLSKTMIQNEIKFLYLQVILENIIVHIFLNFSYQENK